MVTTNQNRSPRETSRGDAVDVCQRSHASNYLFVFDDEQPPCPTPKRGCGSPISGPKASGTRPPCEPALQRHELSMYLSLMRTHVRRVITRSVLFPGLARIWKGFSRRSHYQSLSALDMRMDGRPVLSSIVVVVDPAARGAAAQRG